MRDAQALVGATDFDDLDAEDSDAEESEDDTASFQPRRRRGPMSQFFSSDTLPSRADDFFDSLPVDCGSGLFSYPGRGVLYFIPVE